MGDWNEADHPRVPQGNINGGRFTDDDEDDVVAAAGEASGTNRWDPNTCRYIVPGLEDRLMEKVREVADLDHERGYIINLKTGSMQTVEGTETQIDMDVWQKSALINSAFLHNHPGGSKYARFSEPDLRTFDANNVQEAWVTAGDYIVVVKRKSGRNQWPWETMTDVVVGVSDRIQTYLARKTGSPDWEWDESYHGMDASNDEIRDAIVQGYRDAGMEAYWKKWR